MSETVYLGHDNSINMVLTEGNDAQDLTAATRMTLTLGGVTLESVNATFDPIRWTRAGYQMGEVRLFLGAEVIPPGIYHAPLVVYAATNPEGIVWDYIPLEVKAEVEH
jgi:hypothetical protein